MLQQGKAFFYVWLNKRRTSLVTQMVKHPSTKRETQVRSLGWEDPLEKEMATHSSTLAWKIPWTEERGRLQSMGSKRVRHDWATTLSLTEDSWSLIFATLFNLFPCCLGWSIERKFCFLLIGSWNGEEYFNLSLSWVFSDHYGFYSWIWHQTLPL